MSDTFKEKLSSSDVAQLNRILRKIDMDLFLPLLLEMVLLNVKHAKENIVSMRWDWILVGHLQFNYNSQAQVQAQDATKKLNIQRDNSLALTFLVHFGPICTLYSVMFFRKKRSAYSYTNEKCWTTNLFSIKRISYSLALIQRRGCLDGLDLQVYCLTIVFAVLMSILSSTWRRRA